MRARVVPAIPVPSVEQEWDAFRRDANRWIRGLRGLRFTYAMSDSQQTLGGAWRSDSSCVHRRLAMPYGDLETAVRHHQTRAAVDAIEECRSVIDDLTACRMGLDLKALDSKWRRRWTPFADAHRLYGAVAMTPPVRRDAEELAEILQAEAVLGRPRARRGARATALSWLARHPMLIIHIYPPLRAGGAS